MFPILSQKSQRQTDSALNYQEYELLESDSNIPLHQKRNSRSACSVCLFLLLPTSYRRFSLSPKRALICLVLVLAISVLIYGGIPPSYSGIKAYENSLTQHDWSKPIPSEVYEHKYLNFLDHIWGRGFNNLLQEILLTSYIAYATNRTYVFDDYIWSILPIPYTLYDFALRPTRIPLNAFIAGPIAGGDVPTYMNRAVSTDYFDSICPLNERVSITAPFLGYEISALDIVNWWRERLNKDDVRNTSCLQIRETEATIFDTSFWGSPRVLPLFPHLRDSPMLANLTWSPLILSALENTAAVLFPDANTPNQVVPGLIAIHLRRGDFQHHCQRLASWNSSYLSYNLFDGLVDSFHGSNDIDDFLEHCFPTLPQVVRRLNEVREEHSSSLSQVYILTNAWPSFIATLSSALLADRWETVSSTWDVEPLLTKEQRYVDVGVDMALAVNKAEVFIGNGFSTLSANVVMFRIAKGLPLNSNRFL